MPTEQNQAAGPERASLDVAAVRAAVVRPGGLWRSVEVVPVTGSTNADLLARALAGAPEGVVLAAEVDDVIFRPDLDDAVVRLTGPVAIDQVIAAYVDNSDAAPAVAKAIEVIDAADLGDEDADLIVGVLRESVAEESMQRRHQIIGPDHAGLRT